MVNSNHVIQWNYILNAVWLLYKVNVKWDKFLRTKSQEHSMSIMCASGLHIHTMLGHTWRSHLLGHTCAVTPLHRTGAFTLRYPSRDTRSRCFLSSPHSGYDSLMHGWVAQSCINTQPNTCLIQNPYWLSDTTTRHYKSLCTRWW